MATPMMIAKGVMYRLGVLVIAVIGYFYLPGIQEFFESGFSLLWDRDFDGLRQFILSYGFWAPMCSILLMTLQSLIPFVPGLAITITNAWVFGWQYGAVYSWLGALLGACLDFAIARWYGRPIVEKFINNKYLKLTDAFLRKHGIFAVFITRLTPIIPFKVISYGVGLTTLSFCQFAIATAIGQAPAILIYSVIGQNLTHSVRATVIITSLLLAIGAFGYYFSEDIERRFFPDKE
ncbi:TVP38/TMEM64 family protein [Pelosinus fermentans]|uniref:TVP38/TMEM64 family membrane protein n=1 Tax=Pelosinus fermentans JBW45 TaxID=1192197 RepID=I8U5B8_9FIRM|nr:TVP38/TMEM64 family protein [Pelosinus fermentans]AJQ27410.1 SNARE associated protein [Pelosinus fermentans JBW45]